MSSPGLPFLTDNGLRETCICGALPYDPVVYPHGAVGLIRYRKSKYASDGGYSVGCTRCGRLGERGRTIADAVGKWDGHLYKYGPLKEEHEV